MRFSALLLAALVLAIGLVPDAAAINCYLYVDSAPNAYGSPLFEPWKADAFADVASSQFVNMRNGCNAANVGTTDFEIYDEVVYSFGDLGKRLHWIYWVPEATIADLQGLHFQTGLLNTWDGEVSDFYLDYYGSSWLTPTSWIEYEGGVIGTAGMAWWGAYGINTPEALAADIAEWGSVSEVWDFRVRWDGVEMQNIVCNRDPIPEPSTLVLLLGVGVAGATALARRRGK